MAEEVKDKRLYCVRLNEHFIVSGIEAANAQEAIAIATKKNVNTSNVLEATCDKIYKAGIDISVNNADKDNAVFGITICGTDPVRVDAFKRALAVFIGGPGLFDEDQQHVGNAVLLQEECDNYEYTVEGC